MKILTLVDGSEHSLRALESAVNLLGPVIEDSANQNTLLQKKHEVIILTILQPLKLPDEVEKHFTSAMAGRKKILDKYLKDINSAMQNEWSKRLLELQSKYKKRSDLAITTKIMTGSHSSRFVAYSIVKFAEDESVELIVIGSVGTGGTSENKSLGSVTRNIAEISTNPVLIVP